MIRQPIRLLILTTALLVVPVVSAQAQIVAGRRASVSARFVYFDWTIKNNGEEVSVSQAAFPVAGFVPVRENTEVQFYATGSSNSFDAASRSTSLNGASDVRLQLSQSFRDDHLIVSLGINAPTGKRELEYAEDTTIINALSRNFMRFNMRRFGRGAGFNIMLGGAMEIGGFQAGAGIRYEYTGSYTPYRDLGKYDPGDAWRASFTIERSGRRWYLYSEASVSVYSVDRLEGTNVLRQSPLGLFRLSMVYTARRYQASGTIAYLWRGQNEEYDSGGNMVQERQLYGNELLLVSRLKWRFHPSWWAGPQADFRLIADSDGESKSSSVFGIGGLVGRKLGRYLEASLQSQLYFGDADGGDATVSGLQVTTTLLTTF